METLKTYNVRKLNLLIPALSGLILVDMALSSYQEFGNTSFLLIAVLFGFTTISPILNLFPFISSLVATPKGILVRSFFRKSFVDWNQIEGFENKKVFFQNKILIRFKSSYGKKFLGIPIGRMRNNFTAVLHIPYNVTADELQSRLKENKNF